MMTVGLIDAPVASRGALLRIALTYSWRHGRLPELAEPTRFTELVQLRKLFDRDPRVPTGADMARVMAWGGEVWGGDWVIPTLWQGAELPVRPHWPLPFVLKARHGCNRVAFARTGREDWSAFRRQSRRWMASSYGAWLDEWLYRHIAPGLLIEPFVGVGGALPVDYKFYVFGGRVEFVQVHLGREHRHRWLLFDRDWRRVSARTGDPDPAPPASLDRMIEAAGALGAGIDFVRADFYEPAGRPLFGEMTFYPGSGLDRFDPPDLDAVIGARWLAARRALGHAAPGLVRPGIVGDPALAPAAVS